MLGGILLYALGAGTAPELSLGAYLVGQAMVSSAQITAHYINEYADLAADRLVHNRTLFSGGSGVLASGELAPGVARVAGIAASLLAIGFAAVVAGASPLAAALGLLALTVSWLYSIPPVRLLGTGWGEIATSVVVTILVPVIGALANGGAVTGYLLQAMAVLFWIHMAMMLAFEFPDLETDREAGKRVLAVRLGEARSRWLLAGLYGAGLLTAGVMATLGPHPAPALGAGAVVAVAAVIVLTATSRGAHHVATTAAVLAVAAATLVLVLAATPIGAS